MAFPLKDKILQRAIELHQRKKQNFTKHEKRYFFDEAVRQNDDFSPVIATSPYQAVHDAIRHGHIDLDQIEGVRTYDLFDEEFVYLEDADSIIDFLLQDCGRGLLRGVHNSKYLKPNSF